MCCWERVTVTCEYGANICGVPVYKLPCAEMTIIHRLHWSVKRGCSQLTLSSDTQGCRIFYKAVLLNEWHEKFVLSRLWRRRWNKAPEYRMSKFDYPTHWNLKQPRYTGCVYDTHTHVKVRFPSGHTDQADKYLSIGLYGCWATYEQMSDAVSLQTQVYCHHPAVLCGCICTSD